MLVDLQRVHRPVGVFESIWVVLDIVYTGVGFGGARSIAPSAARPVAAEGVREYDLHLLERLGDVAVALENCHWLAPLARIGRGARDIRWKRAAREEEDVDEVGCDLSGVYTALVVVETGTVGSRVIDLDFAAFVVALAWGVDVAVVGRHASLHVAIARDAATFARMQSHVVA